MKKQLKWCLSLLFALFVVAAWQSNSASAVEQDGTLAPANPDRKIEWEGTPYVTDTNRVNAKSRTLSTKSYTDPVIVDISHHQGNIDWAKASKVIDLAIIRTQYGSVLEDRWHKSYEASAKKYNVPFGVYAYHLATDTADAKVEARDFYNRASKDANFYVIDVEEFTSESGESMRAIVNSFVAELRKYTDEKIGLYIANHLYDKLNLDTSKADFVWIPRYGSTKPAYPHALWQFTDQGKVDGIGTYVDLNRLNGVSLSYFTQSTSKPVSNPRYYTSNPKKIATKTVAYEYNSRTFKESAKVKRHPKNTLLDIVAVEKSASGTPRLKLKNGNYITANRTYVVKTRSDIDEYITKVPKKALLRMTQGLYKSTTFSTSTKLKNYSTNSVFTIKDIDYTDGGTPRLKTSTGYYVSANKAYTRSVVNNISDYYYVNPKTIQTKTNVGVYTSVSFANKTRTIAKGKKLQVTAVTWSAAGTPRLKIGTGQYISANKAYVVKK